MQSLQGGLKEEEKAEAKTSLKKLVQEATIYRTLDEKFFDEPEALAFAQLNVELPYIAASFLTGKFSVLANCDSPERLNGFVESAVWFWS